jgi:hypothetical protein
MPICPSLPDTPAGSPPALLGPSLRPHLEQYARWSAFWWEQCRQARIAVVSLLHPWYRFVMNAAAKTSCQVIEKTLGKSPAFKKVDEGLYVVKQGSSIVMINVLAWNPDRAVVRCVAQLVKGVTMEVPLALQLLEMNALLRFGAFAYVPAGDVIIFSHTLLGGDTLDGEELVTTIRDVAIIADEYDDRIAARYGGQTMQELLEESVIEHFRSAHGKDHFKS